MARKSLQVLVGLVLLLLIAACAQRPPVPLSSSIAAPADGRAWTVFVTSNGFHSAIVLARADLPAGRLPETGDFPQSRFFEFGWGDAEYYPARKTTVGMALRAALLSTPSVVHLAGRVHVPVPQPPDFEVVRLALDSGAVARLVSFIEATFARGGKARAEPSGPGLYATSLFYPAHGRFHLGNTCNTWTARALAAAGLPVEVEGTTMAEDLMSQVRPLTTIPTE